MEKAVEAVLAEYEARSEREWKLLRALSPEERDRRIDEFLISVGRATGTLLNLLIREAKAQTILEVGTSYGYSTVWLAAAARQTGGKVITLEIHAGKQQYARAALAKAGLADSVDFRLGDALETIAALDGPLDFVLLDLWKNLYIPCFDLIYPKLNRGAFVAADNMTFPKDSRDDALAYRRHARRKDHIESVLLPVGSGVELSRYSESLD